ncbi:MAG: helix-turn-helix domain-containing protein [Alcanivorax sp.]|nr:helix-turn-helix domain-containing protein [Alcanivorax sp.]
MNIIKRDLEGMREAAGISQMEMASHLGVSQSQVSRYENDPDEVSVKVYSAWVAYCGDITSKQSLDVGTPMKEVDDRISLIGSYFDSQPIPSEDQALESFERDANISEPKELLEAIKRVGRKPRVGFFGRYDMGKSRLANVLMGSDSLPANYQPATSITCLVRHMDDKPSWQPENVWIMGSDFDLDRADDEEHCRSHRLIGGGYETLAEHGTHKTGKDRPAIEGAATGIVYVDSDFLKGCDIIDLPGYGHKKGDDERAEMAQTLVDIVIYVSHVTGFMNEPDRAYLSQLTHHLPVFETPENSLSPLRNLFIVATRADTCGGDHIGILDKAAYSCYDGIGRRLEQRGEKTGIKVTESEFRNRFFTFSVEDIDLRKIFEKDLIELISIIAPEKRIQELDAFVRQSKSSNSTACRKLVETIERALSKQDQARKDIKAILDKEEDRIRKKDADKEGIVRFIDELEVESIEDCKKMLLEWSDVDHLERVIGGRYEGKKDARRLAPTYVMESIQQELDGILSNKSDRLGKKVDAFLESYDVNVDGVDTLKNQWSFNAKGAFISSLAGLGTFGALAAWASVVAGGSNLGAYILVGKVVSFLASIGVSVGGTGTVFAVISALGGPITVGIGIAVAVGVLAGALFGDSWQRKLAKQIRKGLIKGGAEDGIITQFRKFWSDTRTAFHHAVAETERDYQEKLKALEDIAFTSDSEVLEKRLPFLRDLRDFFAGIPWKHLG